MCLPWRCRDLIALFIILTSVVCEDQLDNAGKMYPRGNHWAVGERRLFHSDIYYLFVYVYHSFEL